MDDTTRVDAGEPLLIDLAQVGAHDFDISARTEVEIDEVDRSLAKALCDVFPGDDQVLAPIVLSTDQDVTVRMTRVEVIDRYPIELRSEVLLGLRHQPPDHRFEILVFGTVLRGDDEPELVRPFRTRRSPGLRTLSSPSSLRGCRS